MNFQERWDAVVDRAKEDRLRAAATNVEFRELAGEAFLKMLQGGDWVLVNRHLRPRHPSLGSDFSALIQKALDLGYNGDFYVETPAFSLRGRLHDGEVVLFLQVYDESQVDKQIARLQVKTDLRPLLRDRVQQAKDTAWREFTVAKSKYEAFERSLAMFDKESESKVINEEDLSHDLL